MDHNTVVINKGQKWTGASYGNALPYALGPTWWDGMQATGGVSGTYTNLTLTNNYMDPVGSYQCFTVDQNPTISSKTITGNLVMQNAGAVTTINNYGGDSTACSGVANAYICNNSPDAACTQ